MPAPLEMPAPGSASWSDWLEARVRAGLEQTQAALAAVRAGGTTDAATVLDRWNAADVGLRNAGAVTSLLSEVHPDEALRTQAESLAQDVDRAATARDLDHDLFAAVSALDPTGLDEQGRRLHARILRDFRRAGVDRDEPTRERLRAISERLTVLDQDFSRRIRDDVRTVRLRPEQLAGLPADYVEAHPPDADGLVAITTDYPDYMPFRTFGHDAAARRELTVAFLSRAWPDNDATLREMLDLRAERATLVGFGSWPDFDAAVKMVGTAAGIDAFVERLAVAARPSAERDRDVLLERLRTDVPGATTLDSSQLGYYQELVRREQYDVDAQALRAYFDFGKVRAGLLDVTGRLFGVSYVPVDTPTWHPDVTSYDVVLAGEVVGRIHLDLHPRDGKYKHAAQFDLAVGVDGLQPAEGALVCNFPRGLMEHDDVVTLFHEFGHLVHHVLGGDQRYAQFSGVATEWDFVEAPSQLLEEWAISAEVLRTFATDANGDPIPAELVERLRAAEDFGKGIFVSTQLFYSAIALVLHRDRPADLDATLRELQGRYSMLAPIEGTHFEASFGHLAGYTSAYYTYMWSLVIAKDLFSAFDEDDMLATDVSYRYRDRVLRPGGSRDAAELVADFLGRPGGFDAFTAWLDRAPAPAG